MRHDPLLVTGVVAKLPGVPGDMKKFKGAKTKKPRKKQANLRDEFTAVWARLGRAEQPVCEYLFHPVRRWRFDVAFPASRVAVELDGGVWSGGRHTRGAGFVADLAKLNAATLLGWRLLRYTADDLRKRPVQVCEEVASLLVRDEP